MFNICGQFFGHHANFFTVPVLTAVLPIKKPETNTEIKLVDRRWRSCSVAKNVTNQTLKRTWPEMAKEFSFAGKNLPNPVFKSSFGGNLKGLFRV